MPHPKLARYLEPLSPLRISKRSHHECESRGLDRHREIRMNRKTKRRIERGKGKKSESEGYVKEN